MKFINNKMQKRYDKIKIGWAIEKVIRETLVIENKQSIYIAVDKIIDTYNLTVDEVVNHKGFSTHTEEYKEGFMDAINYFKK